MVMAQLIAEVHHHDTDNESDSTTNCFINRSQLPSPIEPRLQSSPQVPFAPAAQTLPIRRPRKEAPEILDPPYYPDPPASIDRAAGWLCLPTFPLIAHRIVGTHYLKLHAFAGHTSYRR